MTGIDKRWLGDFAEYNCSRQLLFHIVEDDRENSPTAPGDWLEASKKILLPISYKKRNILLYKQGHEYEQAVYLSLKSSVMCQYSTSVSGAVGFIKLDPSILIKYHTTIVQAPVPASMLLLEHEFEVPREFLADMVNSASHLTFPFRPPYSVLRPDLLLLEIISSQYSGDVHAIRPGGKIERLTSGKWSTKVAINILDIKATSPESVNLKHFIEVIYYAQGLSSYLHVNGLEDRFFVRMENNGILPYPSSGSSGPTANVTIANITGLRKYAVPLRWRQTERVFNQAVEALRQLWTSAPYSTSTIGRGAPLNIQGKCGRCRYVKDCIEELKGQNPSNPSEWNVRVLPCTSPSITEMLSERGYHTIGDVLQNINRYPTGAFTDPIVSEIPFLKLKAKAIASQAPQFPPKAEVYSLAIPKYSDIALIFDAESDPHFDRVFTLGLRINLSVASGAPYSVFFSNWWKYIALHLAKKLPRTILQRTLNNLVLPALFPNGVESTDLDRFLDALNFLATKGTLEIDVEGTQHPKTGKEISFTSVHFVYATSSDDTTDAAEFRIARDVVLLLNQLLTMSEIIETYIRMPLPEPTPGYIGPELGVFYYSKEQLSNIQEMLERHLTAVVLDPITRDPFLHLISAFTPNKSEVAQEEQFRKIYDIRKFVENVIGFPSIINYTWHELASHFFQYWQNEYYWTPYFNYMDWFVWHSALTANNPTIKAQRLKHIELQVQYKLRQLENLRREFQRNSRDQISYQASPAATRAMTTRLLPPEFHETAFVWYMYAKLQDATQMIDAASVRTDFPEYSIGKMLAAEATHLQEILGENRLSFQLERGSSNMRVGEGEEVLLISSAQRDSRFGRFSNFQVKIQDMIWNPHLNAYELTTAKKGDKGHQAMTDELLKHPPPKWKWYLYPVNFSFWPRNLYDPDSGNGLFARCNFGTSWLGERISHLWRIRSNPQLNTPTTLSFDAPEVYAFAPFLLPSQPVPPAATPLLTSIHDPPDDSQRDAIHHALAHAISGIQGPPGTGKSQTIAALVDEFLHRRLNQQLPARILISAFSYAALRVVVEKIRRSKDASRTPTRAALVRKFFLHSGNQDPIENSPSLPPVDDIQRDGDTWKINGQSKSLTTKRPLQAVTAGEPFILFANAFQLVHLPDRYQETFDLIVIDEASQVPTDHILASLQFVNTPQHLALEYSPESQTPENPNSDLNLKNPNSFVLEQFSRVVLVGDHFQLPPVQTVPPPENLQPVLKSVFSFYVEQHKIPYKQLKINYRSHQDIVEYTRMLRIYSDLFAAPGNATKLLGGNLANVPTGWLREVLDPSKVTCTLVHPNRYELGVSELEAALVIDLIDGYFSMVGPTSAATEKHFWKEQMGVVAPHNAQGNLIIRTLYDRVRGRSNLTPPELLQCLKKCIVSVEKFQGSDREFILASVGISSKDQLVAEEDFIYNLNRFNVLTSRARHKVVLVCSWNFLDNFPVKRENMESAGMIRTYVDELCTKKAQFQYNLPGNPPTTHNIDFRWK